MTPPRGIAMTKAPRSRRWFVAAALVLVAAAVVQTVLAVVAVAQQGAWAAQAALALITWMLAFLAWVQLRLQRRRDGIRPPRDTR